MTKERVSEYGDRTWIGIIHSAQQSEKVFKNSEPQGVPWGNIKRSNTCAIGIPNGDKSVVQKKAFEELTESFPILTKDKLINPTSSASPK